MLCVCRGEKRVGQRVVASKASLRSKLFDDCRQGQRRVR